MACNHNWDRDNVYVPETCNKCGRSKADFEPVRIRIEDDPSYGPTRKQIEERFCGKK